MEIERKFLVANLPANLDQYPHVDIEQGYLCTSPTLRIRKMGDVYWLTVKEPQPPTTDHRQPTTDYRQPTTDNRPPITNREEEFRLTEDKYLLLRAKCDGYMVSKTRYRIPLDGLTAELDIFHGRHEGLRLVEVEFPSTEAADSFTAPSWFGEDVSTRPEYRNSFLSQIE